MWPLTSVELDNLRRDEGALRKELESGGAVFRGKTCRCLWHDDRTPSAGIYCKDGVWKFCCQVCQISGDIIDVRALLNKRSVAEEFKAMTPTPRIPPPPPTKIYPTIETASAVFRDVTHLHEYYNGDKLHAVVIRYWDGQKQKKGIAQATPVAGGFILKGPKEPHPLYYAHLVKDAEWIEVVEGEKCADALNAYGFNAVTSLGGAGKASKTDWTPLAGKSVRLWSDNDEPDEKHPGGVGQEHMRDIQAILSQLDPPAKISLVRHDELDLGKGGDVADFIDRMKGQTEEEIKGAIQEVLDNAMTVGISKDYEKYLEEGIQGMRRPVPFIWPMLTHLSSAIVPGCVTVLCGDPGCGKSLFAMESVIAWSSFGTDPVAIFELEDGRDYHLARAHAQLARESRLVSSAFLSANGEFARASRKRFEKELEVIGRSIWESPKNETPTYEMLLKWMEERAKAGIKILIVDPLTAAKPEPKPWIADHEFMSVTKRIAEQYRCSPLLVIHPTKNNKGSNMEGVAGGAAFTRLAHTVIWLNVNEDYESRITGENGIIIFPDENQRPNRVARIAKARNGIGRGSKIAFHFDAKSLTFKELGVMEKDDK